MAAWGLFIESVHPVRVGLPYPARITHSDKAYSNTRDCGTDQYREVLGYPSLCALWFCLLLTCDL